ncbi:MAG TPA: hypothetical protein VF723_10270 [Pyrinomonadaceae bacterium]
MSMEDRVLRLENAFATLVEIQRGLEERFDTHRQWINELGAAQVELTRAQARTEVALVETNERLNSLIGVVERFISDKGSS